MVGFADWWETNGSTWTIQLRSLIIEYRYIGYDWQFSEKQQELLYSYNVANELLVDCLNSSCLVSKAVREEIEKTLLLPIAEP